MVWERFRSIKAKMLLGVFIILSSGIGSVLFRMKTRHQNTAEQNIRKNASDQAKLNKGLFRLLVQESEDRARSWALSRATGGNMKTQLDADSTIRGIEVFRPESSAFEFRDFQESWHREPDEKITADLVKEMTPENPRLYEIVKNALGHEMHRVLCPLQMDESGKISLVLSFYIDPTVFSQAVDIDDDGVTQTLLFRKDGQVLFQSKGVDGTGLLADGKMPPDLLNGFNSPINNMQITVKGAREDFVGSFYKIGFGNLGVAVLTSERHIFLEPRRTALQSLYLGLAILLFSFAAVILLADSLVRPIRALVNTTKEIALGNFSVRSTVKTRDEIFTLANSFNDMAAGLQEREKIKETFGKFHSKAVVQKLLSGDGNKLGGERIPVTVFFSDIRGFTSSSESMTPEAVVEMLNEYLAEMVPIVELHDGVVDKFVGDAIMAVWGLPEANPKMDAVRAVECCLGMREKLAELNARRESKGKPPLKIGMGLNSGVVIAGKIGSHTRMEYTVIGDTVNTASRMESATKDLETDLLVNESTAALLPRDRFELVGPFEVAAKGKSDGMRVFKVLRRAMEKQKAA
jgi:class 3 adenylate cyclase